MSLLLAIDPGPEQSAWVLYDRDGRRPSEWAKEPNDIVRDMLGHPVADVLAVEMVASYGMPVGEDVFRTVWWAGRFAEAWGSHRWILPTEVYRRDVKLHLCGSSRAKDSHIRQAIIDRYGPGKDKAVGLKASRGPLYGMKADCWQALAVAITADEASEARLAA